MTRREQFLQKLKNGFEHFDFNSEQEQDLVNINANNYHWDRNHYGLDWWEFTNLFDKMIKKHKIKWFGSGFEHLTWHLGFSKQYSTMPWKHYHLDCENIRMWFSDPDSSQMLIIWLNEDYFELIYQIWTNFNHNVDLNIELFINDKNWQIEEIKLIYFDFLDKYQVKQTSYQIDLSGFNLTFIKDDHQQVIDLLQKFNILTTKIQNQIQTKSTNYISQQLRYQDQVQFDLDVVINQTNDCEWDEICFTIKDNRLELRLNKFEDDGFETLYWWNSDLQIKQSFQDQVIFHSWRDCFKLAKQKLIPLDQDLYHQF